MSRTRQRRRLLALRREDQRIVDLPTTWKHLPPISTALHLRACRVPFRRQWWPVVRVAGKRWRDGV